MRADELPEEWRAADEALEKKLMGTMQGIESGLQRSIGQLNEATARLSGQMAPTYELYQQLLKSEAERSRLAFDAEQQRALATAALEDKRRLEEQLKEKDDQIAKADERAVEALDKRRLGRWKYASLIIGTLTGALLLMAYILTHFNYKP